MAENSDDEFAKIFAKNTEHRKEVRQMATSRSMMDSDEESGEQSDTALDIKLSKPSKAAKSSKAPTKSTKAAAPKAQAKKSK